MIIVVSAPGPSPNNRVKIWGLLGKGIGDLDTGLTIDKFLQVLYILAVLVLGQFVGGQPMNPSVMRSGTRENQLPVL